MKKVGGGYIVEDVKTCTAVQKNVYNMKKYELISNGIVLKTGNDLDVLRAWANDHCTDYEIWMVVKSNFPKRKGHFKVTRDMEMQVKEMIQMGYTNYRIARIIGITDVTVGRIAKSKNKPFGFSATLLQ